MNERKPAVSSHRRALRARLLAFRVRMGFTELGSSCRDWQQFVQREVAAGMNPAAPATRLIERVVAS
jgi:hypothetical protein